MVRSGYLWWCVLVEDAAWYGDSVIWLLKAGEAPGRSEVTQEVEPGVGRNGAMAKGVRVQISPSPSQLGERWPIRANVGVVIGESPAPLMEKSASLPCGYGTRWNESKVLDNLDAGCCANGDAQCSVSKEFRLPRPVDLALNNDLPSLPQALHR